MSDIHNLAGIRRDYGSQGLNEDSIQACPIKQFELWFAEVVEHEKTDPTAMVLSTVDGNGRPDSRVVLLKGLDNGDFIFYSNYQSTKGQQMLSNPHVALNFYWPEMARQVRVRGQIKKVSAIMSDDYFSSRPLKSQLSAIASPQSQAILNREVLEDALDNLLNRQGQNLVKRPKQWGGYRVNPEEIEFWQGRDNRLHDRIQYCRQKKQWLIRRLAP